MYSFMMPANVFGLCVRAGLRSTKFKFIRSIKLQVCTSARLTQNQCYRLAFVYIMSYMLSLSFLKCSGNSISTGTPLITLLKLLIVPS